MVLDLWWANARVWGRFAALCYPQTNERSCWAGMSLVSLQVYSSNDILTQGAGLFWSLPVVGYTY